MVGFAPAKDRSTGGGGYVHEVINRGVARRLKQVGRVITRHGSNVMHGPVCWTRVGLSPDLRTFRPRPLFLPRKRCRIPFGHRYEGASPTGYRHILDRAFDEADAVGSNVVGVTVTDSAASRGLEAAGFRGTGTQPGWLGYIFQTWPAWAWASPSARALSSSCMPRTSSAMRELGNSSMICMPMSYARVHSRSDTASLNCTPRF